MGLYLRAKFEVSSMIVTRFRQGVILLPPPPPQSEPLKSPPRLGLIGCVQHTFTELESDADLGLLKYPRWSAL